MRLQVGNASRGAFAGHAESRLFPITTLTNTWHAQSVLDLPFAMLMFANSPIMSVAEIYPTMVIVKMGIFPRIPDPECESFALHRHTWQGKHDDLPQFEILRGGKKLGE